MEAGRALVDLDTKFIVDVADMSRELGVFACALFGPRSTDRTLELSKSPIGPGNSLAGCFWSRRDSTRELLRKPTGLGRSFRDGLAICANPL